VAELVVPEVVDDPFREHYRALILGSLLHSAEAQSERHRARGHRLRARRAERAVLRLRPPPVETLARPAEPEYRVVVAEPPFQAAPLVVAPAPAREAPSVEHEPWFGPGIRRTAFAVWLLTLIALIADVLVLGIDSYPTIGADLGLVAMTFVLFFSCIDDLMGPRR